VLAGGGGNLATGGVGGQDQRLAIVKSFPATATEWDVTGVVVVGLSPGVTASATAWAICVNP
jgi:hypothetical protein